MTTSIEMITPVAALDQVVQKRCSWIITEDLS